MTTRSRAIIAFAAEEATFDGKAYALPFDTDTRALYYNIGMLEEAGVDPAEFDPANGPVTWDRVMEIANQLNEDEGDGNYTRVGFIPWQTWSNGQGWHYTFGFSWGADFYDEAGCRVTPTTPTTSRPSSGSTTSAAALDVEKTSAFVAADQPNDLPPEQQYFYPGEGRIPDQRRLVHRRPGEVRPRHQLRHHATCRSLMKGWSPAPGRADGRW